MTIDLADYNTVPERIAEFRAVYPSGSLRPADLAVPFSVVEIGGQTFLVVVAAAYRTAEDQTPGIGMAWEPVPGKTTFTRDSELQNAETSAWGRAIVAALAADTRKGVASAEEVRNRQVDGKIPPVDAPPDAGQLRSRIAAIGKARGLTVAEIADDFAVWTTGVTAIGEADPETLTKYIDYLNSLTAAPVPPPSTASVP